MKLKNLLNPKELLIDSIISKFEKEGLTVNKLFCNFNIVKNTFEFDIENENGSTAYQAEESDVSMLKKLFVSKIINKRKKEFPDENILSIFIDVNLVNRTIDLFIERYRPFDESDMRIVKIEM